MDYLFKIGFLRNSPLGEDEYPEDYDNDIRSPYSYEIYRESISCINSISKFETSSLESFLNELTNRVKDFRLKSNKVKIIFGLKTYDEENVKQIEPKLTNEQKLEKTIKELLQ